MNLFKLPQQPVYIQQIPLWVPGMYSADKIDVGVSAQLSGVSNGLLLSTSTYSGWRGSQPSHQVHVGTVVPRLCGIAASPTEHL